MDTPPQKQYSELLHYTTDPKHANKLANLYFAYVYKVSNLNSALFADVVNLAFSDGTMYLNPNWIGWLVGDKSPLKYTSSSLEATRAKNTTSRLFGEQKVPPIDFTFCKKQPFQLLLTMMMFQKYPQIDLITKNDIFTESLDFLKNICDYLGLLFYTDYLTTIVAILNQKE